MPLRYLQLHGKHNEIRYDGRTETKNYDDNNVLFDHKSNLTPNSLNGHLVGVK